MSNYLYTITILKDRIALHQEKIKELESDKPELQLDIEIAEHEIQNHERSIKELQTVIKLANNHPSEYKYTDADMDRAYDKGVEQGRRNK